LELAVRALSADGRPAPGVTVSWTAAGDATLAGGSTSVTNAEGVATKSATLRGGTPTATVTASTGESAEVTFVLRLESDLGSLFDPGEDPGLASVAEALDDLCAQPSNRLAALCRYLGDISPDDARRAIAELAPTEAHAPVCAPSRNGSGSCDRRRGEAARSAPSRSIWGCRPRRRRPGSAGWKPSTVHAARVSATPSSLPPAKPSPPRWMPRSP
jgi:hypothetical protein